MNTTTATKNTIVRLILRAASVSAVVALMGLQAARAGQVTPPAVPTDLMVPAGSFATYKVKVKSGDGEQMMYVRKNLPHVLVKQEVPAQGLNIELKSIKM